MSRKELGTSELEAVVGGMEYTNNFGDARTYYAGASASDTFTFSFSADDLGEYEALGDRIYKKGMTKAQFDAAMLAALADCSWATPISVKKNSLTPVF